MTKILTKIVRKKKKISSKKKESLRTEEKKIGKKRLSRFQPVNLILNYQENYQENLAITR